MPKYVVNMSLFSRQHNAIFSPGDVVDFAPNPVAPDGEELPADAIVVKFERLVELGAITPLNENSEVK